MADIRPRGSPVGRSFGELNLRTYVEADGVPGVYFYNLDADGALGVGIARRLFQLPYYRARMRVDHRDGAVRFRSRRTHDGVPPARFDASYEPDGAATTPDPGSLPAFLVERYRFYVDSDEGNCYYADIDHEPWELRSGTATIRRNDLFEANGFRHPAGEPLVHVSDGLPVQAEYQLTEYGEEPSPVIERMVAWGGMVRPRRRHP